MEGYITFSQLGQLILFLLFVAVGGYAIVTLRNVNAAVKSIGAILKENRAALHSAIPHLALASEDVAALIGELRAGLGEASKAMGTADQIATYAVVLGEAAKTVINVMAGSRK